MSLDDIKHATRWLRVTLGDVAGSVTLSVGPMAITITKPATASAPSELQRRAKGETR